MPDAPSIAVTVDGAPDLPSLLLKELYTITGRSSSDLRRSILAGEPVYTAALFGNDHIDVAPRLEKAVAFMERHDLAFRLDETYDGESERISPDLMRTILESAQGMG